PLAESLERFWAMGEEAADLPLSIGRPAPPFALLKRVGLPAFSGLAANSFQRQMEGVYNAVTAAALRAAFADTGDAGWAEDGNGERGNELGE
ncbi:MAG TPA: hypothetical protein VLC52_15125, partial [Anaerolineae bacterium]|nr:hypothetical protein [Anaerolineae bacterium]